MHPNSYRMFKTHALPYFKSDIDVLEIGPDRWDVDVGMSLRELVKSSLCGYFCANLENDRHSYVRFFNEYEMDCDGHQFDIVFSANVVEHVRKPWLWFRELARVTKPGGLVVSVSPVSWPYHSEPDCWRLYPEAYRALHEEAGLETVLALFETDGGVTDTLAIGRKP